MKTISSPGLANFILTGYRYQANGTACLQVDDIAQNPTLRYALPVQGQWLSIRLLAVKYCLGTYDQATRQHVPCPDQRPIKATYKNCYTCAQSLNFHPAFYNFPIAQISVQQQEYNLQAHATYLAYFGQNHVKVGITHAKRLPYRWLEQGARAAVVLQVAPDAYQARALEEQVSQQYSISERITTNQKKKLLHNNYNFETAKSVLTSYRKLIAEDLAIPLTTDPVCDLQPYYFFKQPRYLLESNQGQVLVTGIGITMVGGILLYQYQEHVFMQSLKQFLGSAAVDTTSGMTSKIAIQTKMQFF